jgi:cephalosporin-C deacetylase
MKTRISLALLLLGVALAIPGQNLLKHDWKFTTGDDLTWARPGLDDSAWRTMEGESGWENQGLGTYDGFGWYRQEVLVPASLKQEAEKNGGLVLYLGRIDDCDESYWNGEVIGKTGKMPPDYASGYGENRAYSIPADKVLWGEMNTLAVRVYDGGGGGGLVSGPIGLSVKGMEELVVITPVMDREDHLFLNEGPVRFNLQVENKLKEALQGNIQIVCSSDFGEVLMEQSVPVAVKRGKSAYTEIELGNLAPGFYKVKVLLESESDHKRMDLAIGVRPEEIVSPLDRPEDFENYWMRARRELEAVEPQFKLIRQEELCTETREIYLLEMRSLGNILVRGWYKRPVKEGVYPAILHVQGYSTNMVPQWLYTGDDMVALGLNIRGHGNSQDHVDPGFPGYLQHHVEDKELYIYRGAYMDCVRAVDFLYSRKEVDTTRVAVEGGSQGGALSFATAALDPERIDLCVPQVPFLSDFPDYFKVAGWPAGEFSQYFKEHPEIPEEEIYKNLSYIDIKNLAPWIKAPVLMSIGLKDETCPPHINFAAYNQLTVPKEYIAYPEAGHGLPLVNNQVKFDYIRKHFGLDY